MLACRVVCCLHQSDCCIKVGFESGTSHITAFGYHAPITEFGYWFLLNDVMESEGCAMTLTKNLGLFDKHYDWGLCKSLIKWSQDLTRYERCAFIFVSFLS